MPDTIDITMPEQISVTFGDVVDVFTEWMRAYRDNPERFYANYTGPLESYGVDCAYNFFAVLKIIQDRKNDGPPPSTD